MPIEDYKMKENIKPYAAHSETKKEQVTQMFDGISKRYDLLNRIMTFGIDIRWRKKAVKKIMVKNPNSVLDIATGTGDLAIAIAKAGVQKVVGLDISKGMLAIGKEKVNRKKMGAYVEMVLGDSEQLPFENNSFEGVTVAFGVRNFENLDKGLREIFRVLKPQGQLVILETSVPENFPFKQLYAVFTQKLVPLFGGFFTKDRQAYQYLSNSAAIFPYGKAFNNILSKNGFIKVENHPQTLGVASLYCAEKP